MTKNSIKVYRNLNGTLLTSVEGVIVADSNYSNDYILVAPFGSGEAITINFQLQNKIVVPKKSAFLDGTELVEVEPDVFQTWNVWKFTITAPILAGVSSVSASSLLINETRLEIGDDGLGNDISIIGNTVPTEIMVSKGINNDFEDIEDIANEVLILANQADLDSRLNDLELLFGTDGANFVKSDLSYPKKSELEESDNVYIKEADGTKRSTDITALRTIIGAGTFVGVFNTILDLNTDSNVTPGVNGDFARVTTPTAPETLPNEEWRWVDTAWVATGATANTASETSYDNTSSGLTANNVQDAIDEVEDRVDTAETDITNIELKTVNLDSNGNIALDIAVLTSKDIGSPDITNSTGKVIAGLNDLETRTTDIETLDLGNTKLDKDFSALVSGTISSTDLLTYYDSLVNKSITFQDFVSEVNDLNNKKRGVFVSLSALRVVHPTDVAGAWAFIDNTEAGDAFTAIYDIESADWIQGGSGQFYTITDGVLLTARVATNEANITTNTTAIANKFDTANLTDDITGNFTDSTKAGTAKGVYDYVNPINLKVDQDRTNNLFSYVSGGKFTANLTEKSLFEGKRIYANFPDILSGVGQWEVTIDGGAIYSNVTVFNPTTNLYTDFDFSTLAIESTLMTLVYSVSLGKWKTIDADKAILNIAGAGYNPSLSVTGNKGLIDGLDSRVGNVEVGQGDVAIQVLFKDPYAITATAGTATTKITMDGADIPSNETDELTTDGSGDHLIVANKEPGVELSLNVAHTQTGSTGTAISTIYPVIDIQIPVTTIATGMTYRISTAGNTNFSTIGATSDTTGEIFIATGVGTGSGLVQLVVGEVAIETGVQNEFKERSKKFVIPNENYVAGTSILLYQIVTGKNVNLQIDDSYMKALYPGGNGPTSSGSTSLTSNATETPNGDKVNQNEANVEYTGHLNNLLENDRVIILSYQGSGQYSADKNIVLDNMKVIKVLFPVTVTDLSTNVQVSLDNEITYYPVKTRNPLNDTTVRDLEGKVVEMYRNGTDLLIENSEPSVSIEQTYNNAIQSTTGTIVPVNDGMPVLKEVKGATNEVANEFVSLENLKVKTTGKNSFDNEIAIGDLSQADGSELVSSGRLRNINFLGVKSSNVVNIKLNNITPTTVTYGITRRFEYDSNFAFISSASMGGGNDIDFTTSSTTRYIKFTFREPASDLTDPSISDFKLTNTQLEEGNSPTSYIEYHTNELTIPHLLRGTAVKPDRLYRDNNDTYAIERNNIPYDLQSGDMSAYTTGTNIDWITITRGSFDNIYTQIAGVNPGRIMVIGFSIAPTTSLDIVDGEYLIHDSLSVSGNVILTVPSGTYADIAEARTDLTGTNTQYELLNNSTELNVDIDGSLYCEEATTIELLDSIFDDVTIEFPVDKEAQDSLIRDNVAYNSNEVNKLEIDNDINKIAITNIETKTDFISVTQAVDLDTMESDIIAIELKTDFITVTQAVDLDTMESDIADIETKTDFISVTQAVDLDTIESDTTDNATALGKREVETYSSITSIGLVDGDFSGDTTVRQAIERVVDAMPSSSILTFYTSTGTLPNLTNALYATGTANSGTIVFNKTSSTYDVTNTNFNADIMNFATGSTTFTSFSGWNEVATKTELDTKQDKPTKIVSIDNSTAFDTIPSGTTGYEVSTSRTFQTGDKLKIEFRRQSGTRTASNYPSSMVEIILGGVADTTPDEGSGILIPSMANGAGINYIGVNIGYSGTSLYFADPQVVLITNSPTIASNTTLYIGNVEYIGNAGA